MRQTREAGRARAHAGVAGRWCPRWAIAGGSPRSVEPRPAHPWHRGPQTDGRPLPRNQAVGLVASVWPAS